MKKLTVKKTIASLAFSCAALPAFAQEGIVPETAAAPAPAAPASSTIGTETTYWKTEFFDAVLAIRPCKEQGVCAEVHWVNPDEPKIVEYFGDPKLKKSGFGNQVTQDDVKALCGFQPKMQAKQVSANKWAGTLHMRGLGMTFNTEVVLVNENEAHVVTSKAIFSQKDVWKRVEPNDPRYPKCTAPKKN